MSFVAASLFSPPPALAFIEGIGAMEMMLVAVIGLLLFGGKGLPDMARTFGKIVREFKKASSSVEAEVKRVMNEEPDAHPAPPRPKRITPVSLPPSASGPKKPDPADETTPPHPPTSGPASQ
jgi:sec-independent protein translocase protein TatA